MADTVSVTRVDRDLRSAILKHIVDTLDRPCGPGDMIEDRQDALDQIIARHRLASTQPAPAFPREEVERLLASLEWCAKIVERNLYHQHEKLEDVPIIARRAIKRAASYKASSHD